MTRSEIREAAEEAEALIDLCAGMIADFPEPPCETPDDLCGNRLCHEIGCVADKRAALRKLIQAHE